MRQTAWGAALLLGTAALISGCENEREPLGKASCPSWKRNVQPLVEQRCVECHGPDRADGNYRLDAYLEAFGTGTDNTPNIKARFPESTILTVFDLDDIHRELAPRSERVLERWVVECAAQYGETSIHDPGILDPFSPEFHGELLRESNYDFASCAECHGASFEGQASAGSCSTSGCHDQDGGFEFLPGEREPGPKDCAVCHGDLLELGAHEAHAVGGMLLEKMYDCEVCHVVPETFEDVGHVFLANGELDPAPAEVNLTGPAVIPDGPAPTYAEAEQTCSNTYCHVVGGAETNADLPEPSWTDEGPLACTSCHGAPPAEHPQSQDCENCHVAVAAGPDALVSTALHLNGQVDFAADEMECATCHGSAENSAPPVDLDGRSDPAFLTVGAHQGHLNPRFNLAAPVACNECHAVPEVVSEAGHIDTARPAEVFPDVEGVGDLASADGATPSYDFQTGTCSNNYCHGNGDSLSEDEWPGKVDVLSWDAPFTGVYCGSCHGIPPTIFPHRPDMGLARCTECHNDTVDANGTILFQEVDGVRTSPHINGVIDVAFP